MAQAQQLLSQQQANFLMAQQQYRMAPTPGTDAWHSEAMTTHTRRLISKRIF
jgi:hypothetical protein